MNIVKFTSSENLTMTSIEFAKLSGREHKDIVKSIEKLNIHLNELEKGTVPSSLYKANNGAEYTQYILTKDQAELVAMKMDTKIMILVHEKFKELENELKPKLPSNYKEALLCLVKAEEEKEQLLLENKELEKTKAYINDKKTASAMNTASQKSKEAEKLRIRLDEANNWSSIMKQEKIHKKKFPWQPLVKYCKKNNIEMQTADHPVYDTVRTYPAEAWYEVYGIEI